MVSEPLSHGSHGLDWGNVQRDLYLCYRGEIHRVVPMHK